MDAAHGAAAGDDDADLAASPAALVAAAVATWKWASCVNSTTALRDARSE